MNRTGRYHSSRDVDRDVDDYERSAKRRRDDGSASRDSGRQLIDPQFRTLCISPFSQRIPDDDVLGAIYHEFKKFGDFTMKIVYSSSRRLVYVDFRYPEDAFAAKQFHQDKLVLFDEPVRVDVVYGTKPRARSRSPADIGTDSYRRRSPYGPRSAMKDGNSGYDGPPRDAGNYYDRAPPLKDPKYSSHYSSQHVPPEDDETATRTLFVGNLDYDVTSADLQAVFERYGCVEDIDVKRAPTGSGAYAFIRFSNLDMAFRAKVEMSGQTIGRHQCRIGYGKPSPSTCLWVGGIGQWLTPDALGRVFGRHAAVERVEWPPGKNYAYIVFATMEDSRLALCAMRGAPLGGQDRRLRIDYADASHIGANFDLPRNGRAGDTQPGMRRDQDQASDYRSATEDMGRRRDDDPLWNNRGQYSSVGDRPADPPTIHIDETALQNATSISELAACLPVIWTGTLMLKNSAFATRLHFVDGNARLLDSLLPDKSTERTSLKITQRLRMDDSKLTEVRRRVTAAGPVGCSVMLAVPAGDSSTAADSQHRPLKSLVAYLRQKDAAGVILLPPNEISAGTNRGNRDTGLLHAFPPCTFARQQLTKRAVNLTSDSSKEEYLVVLVVRLTA